MIAIKTAVIIYILLQCFFTSVYASHEENPELMKIIRACVDIGDYTAETCDKNELMRRFLYTYRNFEIITDTEPHATKSDKLLMCRTDFVKEALYRAFRIDAPTPLPEKLTELGYCVNNGYYYYSGGYTEYFATDVKDILKVIELDDNSIYVIFSDYYREGNNEPVLEYSSMLIGQDSDGYYVMAIEMDDDFTTLNSLIYPDEVAEPAMFYKYLPSVIIAITLTLAGAVFYIFFLRR